MLYPHSRGNDVTTNQDYIQMIVHWWGVSISLMLLLGTDRPSGHGIVQTRLVDHNRHLPNTFSLTSCRFCLLLTTDIFQSFGSIFRAFQPTSYCLYEVLQTIYPRPADYVVLRAFLNFRFFVMRLFHAPSLMPLNR